LPENEQRLAPRKHTNALKHNSFPERPQAARSAQNGQSLAKFKPDGVKLLVNFVSTIIAGMVRTRTERI
jgi:hypothetical protein